MSVEYAGLNCSSGGNKIEAGLDANRDGTLEASEASEASEVSSTQYACNGDPGMAATAGLASLVAMAAEPAGASCSNGGTKISVGLDSNFSGVLDAAEVTSTSYVCQGADGIAGASGCGRCPDPRGHRG